MYKVFKELMAIEVNEVNNMKGDSGIQGDNSNV